MSRDWKGSERAGLPIPAALFLLVTLGLTLTDPFMKNFLLSWEVKAKQSINGKRKFLPSSYQLSCISVYLGHRRWGLRRVGATPKVTNWWHSQGCCFTLSNFRNYFLALWFLGKSSVKIALPISQCRYDVMTLEITEFTCFILRRCIYKIVLEHYRYFI